MESSPPSHPRFCSPLIPSSSPSPAPSSRCLGHCSTRPSRRHLCLLPYAPGLRPLSVARATQFVPSGDSPGSALHGNIDLPEALGCAQEAEAVFLAFVGLILVCVLGLRRWYRVLEQGQGEAAANHSSVASVGVG
jgi:hypothetical protein